MFVNFILLQLITTGQLVNLSKVKKVGLLGDVDEDEVGNVVYPCGDKVDVEVAKRAWQIYQQVAVEEEVFIISFIFR